jgi:G3E family GTPase
MSATMIPVSVLTGFLGSGKTTMLRHLLRQPEFSRTAVIINEFGEVGLDHELVEASEDSLIALQTGCLCCKIRTDLAQTLQDLLRRRDEGRCAPFERIVIETSGLADPAPILQTLMTDAAIADRLVLGGVVTTVDAVTGAATLAREGVSQKQIAVADRIVLTKSDLAGAAEPALLRRLDALNAGAPVLTAAHGRIDPARIFDCALYDPRTKSTDVQAWLAQEAHGHANDGHAHDGPAYARHDADIAAYAILRDEPIPAVALALFLEALAEHCGDDMLRLKGIVNVCESPDRPAVIHGVQHVFHAPAWLDRWPSEDRGSRMVFIVRRIPQRWVELLLAAIIAEVADVRASATACLADALEDLPKGMDP